MVFYWFSSNLGLRINGWRVRLPAICSNFQKQKLKRIHFSYISKRNCFHLFLHYKISNTETTHTKNTKSKRKKKKKIAHKHHGKRMKRRRRVKRNFPFCAIEEKAKVVRNFQLSALITSHVSVQPTPFGFCPAFSSVMTKIPL